MLIAYKAEHFDGSEQDYGIYSMFSNGDTTTLFEAIGFT